MISEKITCDICKAERGIDNHWFLADDTSTDNPSEGKIKAVEVVEWNLNYTQYHAQLCSIECTGKFISKIFFSKESRDANSEGSNLSSK
jgi:hypothetical protein